MISSCPGGSRGPFLVQKLPHTGGLPGTGADEPKQETESPVGHSPQAGDEPVPPPGAPGSTESAGRGAALLTGEAPALTLSLTSHKDTDELVLRKARPSKVSPGPMGGALSQQAKEAQES